MATTTMTALTKLRPTATLRAMTTYANTVSRRAYSTKKPANPTAQFYRQFTRPVAKTLLLAVFTYQFAYWAWAKAEADEIRADRDATIASLEATVNEYQARTKGTEDKSTPGKTS